MIYFEDHALTTIYFVVNISQFMSHKLFCGQPVNHKKRPNESLNADPKYVVFLINLVGYLNSQLRIKLVGKMLGAG